jgi:hypothetical protein
MPKQGFTALTVSVSSKDQLSKTAQALGYKTVPALIRDLLANTSNLGKNTSIFPFNGVSRMFETGLETRLISETENEQKGFDWRPLPGFEPGLQAPQACTLPSSAEALQSFLPLRYSGHLNAF